MTEDARPHPLGTSGGTAGPALPAPPPGRCALHPAPCPADGNCRTQCPRDVVEAGICGPLGFPFSGAVREGAEAAILSRRAAAEGRWGADGSAGRRRQRRLQGRGEVVLGAGAELPRPRGCVSGRAVCSARRPLLLVSLTGRLSPPSRDPGAGPTARAREAGTRRLPLCGQGGHPPRRRSCRRLGPRPRRPTWPAASGRVLRPRSCALAVRRPGGRAQPAQGRAGDAPGLPLALQGQATAASGQRASRRRQPGANAGVSSCGAFLSSPHCAPRVRRRWEAAGAPAPSIRGRWKLGPESADGAHLANSRPASTGGPE